jgi:site-specific DNA-methyltransferase (adenine-specific)/modification methylase
LAASTKFDNHKIIGDDRPFNPEPFLSFETVVLFGANHFASSLPASPNWLIWDKRDSVCTNDQADCEMAWTNKKTPARLMRHLWNGMLKASEKGVKRVHPTQKPIAVMEWAIKQVGCPDTILDPFMGSGTTLVACAKLGRSGIGIELDEDYFNIACERVEKAYQQTDLFVSEPRNPIDIKQESFDL